MNCRSMLLLIVLSCMCQLVSSNMCVVCQPGKYNTVFSNRPCQECEANTYSPNTGMTTCLPCAPNSTATPGSTSCACLPGMIWTIGSTACVPFCAQGLARSLSGGCTTTSNTSLVLNMEITLELPVNTTTADVEKVIATAVADAYGVQKENLLVRVTILPVARRRGLLQATSAVRYAVEIRIVFPSDTSAAEIYATTTRLGGINSTELDNAVQANRPSIQLRVLASGPVEIRKVFEMPNTPTPSIPAPSTPAPSTTTQSTPAPIVSNASDIMSIIIGVSVFFSVGLLVLLACLCERWARKSISR